MIEGNLCAAQWACDNHYEYCRAMVLGWSDFNIIKVGRKEENRPDDLFSPWCIIPHCWLQMQNALVYNPMGLV